MRLPVLAFAATLFFAGLAYAHAPPVGVNGGRQVDAGEYHVEMVVEGSALTIYVRDHSDRPVTTTGFRGTAILALPGRAERFALEPAGDNRLKGTSSVPLPARPRGAVQITTRAGGTIQGRFN